MLTELVCLAASLVGGGEGSIETSRHEAERLITENFSSKIIEIKNSFNAANNGKWNPTSVVSTHEITSNNEVIGYTVSFDEGQISFDKNGILLNDPGNENQLYGNGNYSGLVAIDDLATQKGFSISSCLGKIYSLSGSFQDFSWGSWTPISIKEDSSLECVQIATMDLLYTYKVSGRGDLTKGHDIPTLMGELKRAQVYSATNGTTKDGAISGLSKYLSDQNKATLVSSNFDGSKPTLGFFSALSQNDFGHCAMIFGKATTTSWWIFKKDWSIVMSSVPNYVGTFVPTGRRAGCDYGIFGIENSHKNAEFSLMTAT